MCQSQEFSELFPHRKLKTEPRFVVKKKTTDIQYENTFEFSDN